MLIHDILRKGNELFSKAEMIGEIDKQPFVPEHTGAWLPWFYDGLYSRTVYIEVREGQLEFLEESDPYGPDAGVPEDDDRYVVPIKVPHFKMKKKLTPGMFEGVPAFGQEVLESVTNQRNIMLSKFNRNNRLMWEIARIGAITGLVRGPQGQVIRNWFNKLGNDGSPLVQTKKKLDWSSAKIRSSLVDAKRLGEEKLGDLVPDGWLGIAGSNVFDALLDNQSFEKSVERYNDGSILRDDMRAGVKVASDINVVEYSRATVAGVELIGADDFYLVPKVEGMFQFRFGPGTGMSDLGAQGRAEYVSTEDLPHDGGVELKGSTNPIAWLTHLESVVKVEQE